MLVWSLARSKGCARATGQVGSGSPSCARLPVNCSPRQSEKTAMSVAQTTSHRSPAAAPPPSEITVIKKLSRLDRFLPLWIALAMAVGLVLGALVPSLNDGLDEAPGRDGLAADRDRPAGDDVPGPCEGPLRGHRPHERRRGRQLALLRHLSLPLMGRRPAADVRARVGLPRRSARLPDRGDHRRPGPLHRHGARLERHRPGRPGACRGARRLQRALPGCRLLRCSATST